MGQLRHSSGGQAVELVARVTVGRAPSCDLRLADRRVSGEHASIYFEDDHWRIRDLASSNGTRVNGTSLNPGERHVLLQGDVITFGSQEETWELVDETPPPDRGILDTSQVGVDLLQVSLVFRVSADAQEVELTLVTPRERVRLGQRAFTELLLLLAQTRLADQASGLREQEQGWVQVDDVVPALYPDTDTLNINIFRARRQLEAMGIGDAGLLIERRVRSRRLRLGVANVKIARAPSTFRPGGEQPEDAAQADGSGPLEMSDATPLR